MKADAAFELLKHALQCDRLATAYILAGNTRTSGEPLALKLLTLLFCEAGGVPCGECGPCRRVAGRVHPDVLWVHPQKRSRIISVEQVRELQGRVQQTSYEGGWKACVIVGADRLGPEASNAFLKTLEEPPGRSLFLLLTDSPQFLLPTVRSRCQPISVDDASAELDEWDRELIEILSAPAVSGGAATRGLARGNQIAALLKLMKDSAQSEINEAADAEAVEEDADTLSARGSSRYREMRTRLMRTMLLWYRDQLLLACGGDENSLTFGASLDPVRDSVQLLSSRQALKQVRIVEHMHDQLERNLPEATVLGYGFGHLKI